MKIKKLLLLLISGLFLSYGLVAQEVQGEKQQPQTTEKSEVKKTATQRKVVAKPEVKLSLDSGTVSSQFDYVIKKSNRYEDYKVVKIHWLNKLKANVSDTLNLADKNLQKAEDKIATQTNEINSLKEQLMEVKDQLAKVSKEKNSVAFFGILMEKSAYNALMWTIAGGLLALAIICFLLFKRSNAVTVSTKQSLEDTREEFDKHRKWALEREQTLARELHKLKTKIGS
ncbi:MAG: tRNA (guanine-N1)-methyltransferase [Marinifilaceae bacterium]